MAKSFIERIQPNLPREKVIDWPFPIEGDGPPPKLKLRVLCINDKEGAYLATVDHFKDTRPKVGHEDPAFMAWEQVEIVWRAYADEDGDPITDSPAELAKEPHEMIMVLAKIWSEFQQETTVHPATSKQMDELVDALKKNIHAVPLDVLPSSWLTKLITILVNQLNASMTANEAG